MPKGIALGGLDLKELQRKFQDQAERALANVLSPLSFARCTYPSQYISCLTSCWADSITDSTHRIACLFN